MKQQPDKSAVLKEHHVSKNQSLTQNGAHHGDVHRISDITIQPRNNQMAGWEDWRRRTHTLDCESDKRIQDANEPHSDKSAAGETKRLHPEERSSQAPTGDPPGHQTTYETGSED